MTQHVRWCIRELIEFRRVMEQQTQQQHPLSLQPQQQQPP
eukprot:CAMPEP_0170825096 /NCGR_PEP_ID=MMETSP0733-20121128/45711_1 /TAXON_ID=186038 /ORGANISM="Fragilariopsis kerguelensis, Strain L26-C5" /LENGTH=39 /DNA_ID= /DNA_START= /DNA_END= /DNA_ORIENTATION=